MAERITNEIIKQISVKLDINEHSINKSTPIASLTIKDIEEIMINICKKLNFSFNNYMLEEINELFNNNDLNSCDLLLIKISQAIENNDQDLSLLYDNFRNICGFILNSPSHQQLASVILNGFPSLAGFRIQGGDEVGLKTVIAYGREWEGMLGLEGLLKKDYPIEPRSLFIAYTSLGLIEQNQEKAENHLQRAKEINNIWGPYINNNLLKSIASKKVDTKSSGCFIATACYGSYSSPQVLAFREFRDSVLSANVLGRAFVKIYYLISPYIASIVRRQHVLKLFARAILDKVLKYI